MNIEQANEIRDRIRENPQEIRVLCPRGHFIAHIALVVHEVKDPATEMIWMHPRGPDKQYVFNIGEGAHGFRLELELLGDTGRPAIEAGALTLATLMDNPKAFNHWASAAKQLSALLGELHKCAVPRRGRLAVQEMSGDRG